MGYSSTPTNTRGTSEVVETTLDVERKHSMQNDQIRNRMNTGACEIMETLLKTLLRSRYRIHGCTELKYWTLNV